MTNQSVTDADCVSCRIFLHVISHLIHRRVCSLRTFTILDFTFLYAAHDFMIDRDKIKLQSYDRFYRTIILMLFVCMWNTDVGVHPVNIVCGMVRQCRGLERWLVA